MDIRLLLLIRPKISINITSDVYHCHAPGNKSPWMPHPSPAMMSSHAAFMASNRDIWSCSLWSYAFHLHTQTTVVIVLWAIYIYMLPNLIGYSKWLTQILLQLFIYLADAFIQSDLQMRTLEQLELICQFSRHYKQGQCQIFMEYTRVYTHFW